LREHSALPTVSGCRQWALLLSRWAAGQVRHNTNTNTRSCAGTMGSQLMLQGPTIDDCHPCSRGAKVQAHEQPPASCCYCRELAAKRLSVVRCMGWPARSCWVGGAPPGSTGGSQHGWVLLAAPRFECNAWFVARFSSNVSTCNKNYSKQGMPRLPHCSQVLRAADLHQS
jgi:hypothetical protein